MSSCICNKCRGNGFIWVDIPNRITKQCSECKCTGECGSWCGKCEYKSSRGKGVTNGYRSVDRARKVA